MLLLALLFEVVVEVTAQTETLFEARCHQDVYLPCDADFQSSNYFSVTWYKGEKTGIIRTTLKDRKQKLFEFSREFRMDDQNRLLLPRVTPTDSGRYECSVGANVGGQNLDLPVRLSVLECEETTVSVSIVDTGGTEGTEGTAGNRTDCGDCPDSAPPLPLWWSLLGSGAVALTKILLSTIIIWGSHIWMRRRRRW